MRHITPKTLAWLLGLAWLASSAAVSANPSDSFVGAKGFVAVQPEKLEGSRYYAATRFPKMAGLDALSRKPLSTQEAAAMDCLGQPCTTLESAEGPKGGWKPQKPTPLPPSFKRSTQEGPVPAHVVEQLLAMMGEDAQRGVPFAPNSQRLVFVVSANAGGQEHQTTGLARNALVFDDSVGTQWVRFHQIAGTAAEAQALSHPRK